MRYRERKFAMPRSANNLIFNQCGTILIHPAPTVARPSLNVANYSNVGNINRHCL